MAQIPSEHEKCKEEFLHDTPFILDTLEKLKKDILQSGI